VKATAIERARALRAEGKLDQASALCEELIGRNPRDRDALFLAGTIDLESNRSARAAERLKSADELKPGSPPTLTNLGIAHGRLGALGAAEDALRRALQAAPGFAPASFHLGIVLCDLGRWDEALSLLSRAADAEPKSLTTQYTLVKALTRAGRPREAVARFDRAIMLAPKPAELCLSFALELERCGHLEQAEALACRSTELAPQAAAGFAGLGSIQALRQADGPAVAALERAVTLDPALAVPLAEKLGHSWFRLGCLDEALACRERALALEPRLPETESALVFLAPFREGVSASEQLRKARAFSDRYARVHHGSRRPHENDRSPERRLRVGYVSPDFRAHVQRCFVLPVFGAHDHAVIELVCYSSVKHPDGWTERIRAHAGEWHDVSGLDDGALAEKIRGDRIDVLVDLTMHMTSNRLLSFAARPAPVQISWLAYPGTTGLDGIDYRITDPVLDPPGTAHHYSERALSLSRTFWCYDPLTEEPAVGPLPLLATGHVTFGCLNNFVKVNQSTLALWARVLRELPDSRLVLFAPASPARDRARAALEREGVDSARVEFLERLKYRDFLAAYQRIDVALDCLPYNGHTTSLDAFWMGVPVVTQVGDTIVGRAGASMAQNLELEELVAHDADAFVSIATTLARSPDRLAELRRGLRARMKRSPLMDAAGFARELEHAYRVAWRAFCAGA